MDPDGNPRWIVPPQVSSDMAGNFEIAVDTNGLPITTGTSYYAKLFDRDTGYTVLRHFHYDPELERYDPEMLANVDYTTIYDPARYTDGPGELTSNELAWGPNQVGKLWWDVTRRRFTDYRGRLPDYDLASREWGKLFYYRANVTRTNDIVTVETLDPYTQTQIAHGLSTGDTVTIEGSKQDEYNGVEVPITVIDSYHFSYEIETEPVSPATGDIRVIVGAIDVYEWVESPVSPENWETYTSSLTAAGSPSGTVLNSDDPSYVTRTVVVNGASVVRYYFWVKDNSGTNLAKTVPTTTLVSRLKNPTINGLPWFAPVDRNHVLIYTDGERVDNNYGLEISVDSRTQETHYEWLITP